MATRTPYAVLGVSSDASEEDIKRSYRRLALKLHPDKATGDEEQRALAERRFKEVNEAYSLLSDPARRERYDLYGDVGDDEDLSPHHSRGGGSGRRSAPPPTAAYISIDELIAMTFGTRRRRYAIFSEEPLLVLLIQLLPLLIFLAVLLAEPFSTPPPYAGTSAPFRLQAGSEYTIARRTDGAGVAFFVRADFEALMRVDSARAGNAIAMVHAAVESLDRQQRREACDVQLRRWQMAVNTARRTPKGPERDARVQEAEAIPTPECTVLYERYAESRSASDAFKAGSAQAAPHAFGAGQAWRAGQTSPTKGAAAAAA
eukprot:CAMPEP_0174705458 /NCGR_PEP_ID=MMETSP1094-20130205/8676_1 /TAXON_ID=156173 /ORGANISM="Chrysochromulina brevifilum, Strain UTEX LB 985" /LENGTH=315 /DNA_ID=CAMNT_0015903625 /DNA_START=42 /DNA_END=989 /DNA_ORIENTATION=-